jgi:hypothetical protein
MAGDKNMARGWNKRNANWFHEPQGMAMSVRRAYSVYFLKHAAKPAVGG